MSDESFMNAAGESHDCVLPAKAPNKDRTGSAEGLEGRRSTKENTGELNPSRTQSREIGSRGLEGVREAAKRDKGLRFTALLQAHGEMPLALYVLLHSDARMSEADAEAIFQWTQAERTRLIMENIAGESH